MNEFTLSSEALFAVASQAAAEGRSFTIAGTGTSMAPFIDPENDRLMLSPLPDRELLPGDIVLYSRPDGKAVIHRVLRVHRDSIDMLGDGQLWVEEHVPKERAAALVTKVIKPDREILCDCDEERRRSVAEMRGRLRTRRKTELRDRLRSGIMAVKRIVKGRSVK